MGAFICLTMDFFGHAAVVVGGSVDSSVARNQFRRRMLARSSGARRINLQKMPQDTKAQQSEASGLDRKRAGSFATVLCGGNRAHATTLARSRGFRIAKLCTTIVPAPAPQPGTPPAYPVHLSVTRVDAQLCARDLQRVRRALRRNMHNSTKMDTCVDTATIPTLNEPNRHYAAERSADYTLVENLCARYPEVGVERILMLLRTEGGHAGRTAARLRLGREIWPVHTSAGDEYTY